MRSNLDTLYALRVGSLVGRAPDQDPLTACTARGWGFVLVTFVARSGFEEVRVGTKRAAVSVHSTRLRVHGYYLRYYQRAAKRCSWKLERYATKVPRKKGTLSDFFRGPPKW